MSEFLGPIHHWLFNKIQFQDQLTNKILEEATKKQYCMGLSDQVTSIYGSLPQGKLEEIIDCTNIHGWLQEQVKLVESRLAYVVTSLLDENKERLWCIMGTAYEFGKAHGLKQKVTVREVYTFLQDYLLDGMPCDHVNRVIEESEEKLSWEQTVDVHEVYWTLVNGRVKNYYDIREALIKGLVTGTQITFTRVTDRKYVLY